MSFNPLEERGIPLDRQLRTWRELDVEPVDPDHADPYTKCRIIAMNGIEIESILFSHDFARVCPDLEVKRQLAEVRYIEQQQQKVVNWTGRELTRMTSAAAPGCCLASASVRSWSPLARGLRPAVRG
jgi:hypothetical protein